MHRAVLLFFCLTLSCNAALARPQQPEEDRIKTAVSMVVVGVTVTDSAGKFVEHLRHGDFTISDDGIKQPVSYFAVDLPTDVLILIEAGPAVYRGRAPASGEQAAGRIVGTRPGRRGQIRR
jgi:hypothetical protein